jgi:hypothetical protein
MEDETILNILTIPGPMKGQKEVAMFFQKQAAEERQSYKECAERRRNKEERNLNKTTEEIRQLAQHAKEMRLAAKGKRMKEREEQKKERDEALAKEEEAEIYSRAAALRLHKRVYKEFLNPKRKKGTTVNRRNKKNFLENLNESFPKKTTDEIDNNVKGESSRFDSPLEISQLRYHTPALNQTEEVSLG